VGWCFILRQIFVWSCLLERPWWYCSILFSTFWDLFIDSRFSQLALWSSIFFTFLWFGRFINHWSWGLKFGMNNFWNVLDSLFQIGNIVGFHLIYRNFFQNLIFSLQFLNEHLHSCSPFVPLNKLFFKIFYLGFIMCDDLFWGAWTEILWFCFSKFFDIVVPSGFEFQWSSLRMCHWVRLNVTDSFGLL
jgi:hypothetical protein